LRVSNLILPGFAVLALAGAPTAAAAGSASKGGSGGGSSKGGGGSTSSGGSAPSSGGASTANSSPTATASGGVGIAKPATPPSTPVHPIVQGNVAKIINGVAYAPSFAPLAVKEAIWAGNEIRHTPYVWGGGHQSFDSAGYDCSGAVSFVLHAGGLLDTPFDSSQFMSWDRRGHGSWITVYTNPGHAFIQIAGIRFDTSAEQDPNPPPGSGPRWRPLMHSTQGFNARHPTGF
jgi:hypothetical protein